MAQITATSVEIVYDLDGTSTVYASDDASFRKFQTQNSDKVIARQSAQKIIDNIDKQAPIVMEIEAKKWIRRDP